MLEIEKYPKFANDSKLKKRILFLEVEWHRAYPLVDLSKQLGWAHAWLVTSGKRYSDMARFLNNWYRRCQADLEKYQTSTGPIKMPTPKKYVEEKPAEDQVMSGEDFARMREHIGRVQ